MSKFWKIALILIGAVVLLSILVGVFGGKGDAVEVQTELSAKRSVIETVTASGKIQPETEVKIQSEVSGQIFELPVKEGDHVEKGQLLVMINPDLYTAAVNRAEASLNSARSNFSSSIARKAQAESVLRLQETNYNRMLALFKEKAISQSELDNATNSYENAKAELVAASETIKSADFAVASAQATANEARDNLRRTKIVAPMSGTVTALTKEVGETVLGNNMMSGDIIMKISALDFMEVNVEVNESDIVRVNVGDTSNVEVDAFKNEKFKGVVTEISNTATNATASAVMNLNEVTNFSVKVRIVRESYEHLCKDQPVDYSPFRPGMSATVEIETELVNDAITVPIKAVTSREDTTSMSLAEKFMKEKKSEVDKPDEPYTVVFVMNESTKKAEIRVVTTGIQDSEYIHILSGVNEGEKVIVGPYDDISRNLKNGYEVVEKKEQEESKE